MGGTHASVRKERKKARNGLGREMGRRAEGKGLRKKSSWAAGVKRKGKWWAGLEVDKEKEKVLYFSKAILTLSIQIQTLRFEFKLNNKQIKKCKAA